jgi:hypothetical protein
MSLEADLAEWARWCRQGCQVGSGYPAESCIEHLAIPYKVCQTAEEQYEDFMASRGADERIGERMELWVRQIHEPMRTAIRIQYVELPDSARWPNLTLEQWQEWRARMLGRLLSAREGSLRVTYSPERYEAALSLAMDLLADIEKRWVRGV